MLREMAYQRKLAEEGIDPYAAAAAAVVGGMPILAAIQNRGKIDASLMGVSPEKLWDLRRPGDIFVTGEGTGKVKMKDILDGLSGKDLSEPLYDRLFSLGTGPKAHHTGMISPSGEAVHHIGARMPRSHGREKWLGDVGEQTVTLLRPKTEQLADKIIRQSEVASEGISPKIKNYKWFDALRNGAIDSLVPDSVQRALQKVVPQQACSGTMCSNLVTSGTGNIGSSIAPKYTMPRHLLNASDDFEQVASTLSKNKNTAALSKVLRAGLVGAGGIGLGYGTYKGVKALRDYFGGDE